MATLITCDFLGRWGNNLFQVAAMIGYSRKYNVDYGIPAHYHHREIYRHWKLPVFRGNERILQVYNDTGPDGFVYREIPFFPGGVKLRGFFQCERYFKHCEDEIRQTFKLNIEPIDRIGIHVRRGDYVQHRGLFLPTELDEVKRSVLFFKERGFEKFLICSDDIRWCKENIDISQADFKFNEGTDYFTDMSMLASCQGNVVSRSSFSWWAAWLNPNLDKLIVSLTPWFGAKNNLNAKDVVPENWIKI